MKIQSLRFMVKPGSSAKSVSAMLWERLGFMITPTLPLKIILMIQNNNLLSPNMMSVPLWKETLLHIQLLPEIAKGRKKVMKNLDYFQQEGVDFSLIVVPTDLFDTGGVISIHSASEDAPENIINIDATVIGT